MRKGWIKAAVLLAVFIVSTLIFGKLMNHTNEDLTTEMQEASLPVVSLYSGGVEINELHGYTAQMDAAYMRDTITPIGEDRILPVAIQTYQAEVDGISYEIRSLDAKRLIADADVAGYEEQKGKITARLTIQNLLEAGEEYLLIIMLSSGGETIYYYTRIVEPVDCYVDECIAFALDFNDKTFNDETVGTLSTYMEKTTEDNTTLHFVSLHSTLNQIGWADFKGERLDSPVPSVKEITSTYNVIVLSYVIAGVGQDGASEYYNVEEYYRIRYTSSRIYLLNFERTMNEIFRGEGESIVEQYIQLGIRSEDVEYKANEAATCVAFVQEGELWSYDRTENALAKVFSFRGYEGIEDRENYGEHGIRIVRVDEAGSVDFIVYGYMNRGIHEGRVGMAVYHYDSLANSNEELAFIPSDRSYEVMKSEFGQLMYVNEEGELFLMIDGTVYGIDLDTLKTRELVKGLTDDAFAVSASNRFLAWVDAGQVYEADTVHVFDFSTGRQTDISEGNGEYVKPLGFMEEDFVYGAAHASDVGWDAGGNVAFRMYKVSILDVSEGKEVLKTYEKDGYLVTGVEMDGQVMYLQRVRFDGEGYVETEQDMILNREGGQDSLINVGTAVTEEKETQVRLILPGAVSGKTPRLLTPRETVLEEDRTLSLEDGGGAARYYVYVKGDVVYTSGNIAEAVIQANAGMGVVIGEDQRYVWKRSRKSAVGPFSDIAASAEDASAGSVAQCISAMLQREGMNISVGALTDRGETPKSILTDTMKDMQVIDLTGCSVEETLYYVSCGSTVLAMTGENDAVLIVGYDASNVFLFDPALDSVRKMVLEEADELFAEAGSIFFTYFEG